MRRNKALMVTSVAVFLSMGAVFAATGIGLYASFANFRSAAVETEAVITQLNIGGSGTVFAYQFNGAEYRGHNYNSNGAWYIGKVVTIYVDPADPGRFRTDVFKRLGFIFTPVGFAFLLAGAAVKIKQSGGKKLMVTGRRVTADITDVVRGSVRINSRYAHHIICGWRGPDGKIYRFKSEALWTKPSAELERRGIKNLPVYIDGDNHKKYYVDVGILTEKAADLT